MNYRNPVENPLTRVEKGAAVRARNMIVGTSGAAHHPVSGIPSSITTDTTDGDGNIQTVHPFFLGIDSVGDPYAILTTVDEGY